MGRRRRRTRDRDQSRRDEARDRHRAAREDQRYGRQALLPHNAIYVLIGAGLLWFGWFGFNGGSGIGANPAGVLAFVNTLLTPACALITWFLLDAISGRKMTAIGAATAIIVGCVLVTPAGAYMSRAGRWSLGWPARSRAGSWSPTARARGWTRRSTCSRPMASPGWLGSSSSAWSRR